MAEEGAAGVPMEVNVSPTCGALEMEQTLCEVPLQRLTLRQEGDPEDRQVTLWKVCLGLRNTVRELCLCHHDLNLVRERRWL